jgi:hypothetical protein
MHMTQTITIRGIVIPISWNEKGDVVSVAIATYNEEKYLVENNVKGQQLFFLLRKRVVIDGVLTTRDKIQSIDINNFREDTSKV